MYSLRPTFRSRTTISVLLLLASIWALLWRFGDYGYPSWTESPVIPSFRSTSESWEEVLAAVAAGENAAGVERKWRKDRERKMKQEIVRQDDIVCQQPLVVGEEEQKRIARIAELELELEKEKNWRQQESKLWDKATVLNGPPAKLFRDNLKNDTYYLTSWTTAGFTNQFMGYVNMIYLATLTDRVPIVPPFAPFHHISAEAGVVSFGDIFDLELLSSQLRVAVLEWRDVKILPETTGADSYPYVPKSPEWPSEPIGCWSTRAAHEHSPHFAEQIVRHIGVDASYTRVPFSTRYQQSGNPYEEHINFPHLAALIYRSPVFSSTEKSDIAPSWNPFPDPEREHHRYEELSVSPDGHHRGPDSHLTCFDVTYWMSSGAELYEWRFGFSPVWRTVGRWLKFSKKMHEMTKEYLDVLFGRASEDGSSETPPFIAVHVRRGDFKQECGHRVCSPPLSVYGDQVDEVRRELQEKKGIEVQHVVLMSDETSADFWGDVRALGWLSIDHHAHQTFERFGEWFPPIIDIAVQSYAVGFVGTEDSTFSMISQKRVIDWNGGVVRSVDSRHGDWMN
ncbi:hypothetical protein CPB83DRAFT_836712 [Crepidotus variabilis]|uniref:Peptide-O-fucosyltransferase n=1 Tax=Crepidotus variabilis TaxID=179855 RepID=A0A9P6EDZ3_9AGAR|nr:hypothetical protein CPB83DRAFT_836712 [Crepidotus variabilis]